jgi:hypothetical protein
LEDIDQNMNTFKGGSLVRLHMVQKNSGKS